MVLKLFFDISISFRFLKISVECTLHSEAPPWIGEPTSDQKLRPIVAVRGHCGLGSLFVEHMFKFENLFILVV